MAAAYRMDPTYQALEKIIQDAGIKITYRPIEDDPIDGEIWARTDADGQEIAMPIEDDAFPDEETACLILGHEMGHILSGLNSPDDPEERRKNEEVCDQIGVYLFRLAGLTMEENVRKEWGVQ